jgi:hypothetical protein
MHECTNFSFQLSSQQLNCIQGIEYELLYIQMEDIKTTFFLTIFFDAPSHSMRQDERSECSEVEEYKLLFKK